MYGLQINSTGSYAPGLVVTNQMFETVVDTNDEWITSRTGIKRRHFASPEEDTISMAVKAARDAIQKGGINKEDIGFVIVATFSSDYMTPSAACMLQRELGLPEQVMAFDVNAACSGFIYALNVAYRLLCGAPDKVALVVASETISKVTDFSDRSTCVLFGDGAGAVVASVTPDGTYRFVAGAQGGDEALRCPGVRNGGSPFAPSQAVRPAHHVYMNGREVFRFAVDSIQKSIRALLDQGGQQPGDVDYFVCHQANYRILSSAAKKLGIPEDKFYTNLEEYGNTSAASVPLVLDEMNQKGLLKRGMNLVCAGFGGGLTYGAMQFIW